MRLSGKAAIVTGGGRGLGKAIALLLASEGADLALLARTQREIEQTAREIGRLKRRAYAIKADVSSADQATRAVGDAVRRLGKVDILVNDAGMIGPIGPAWRTDVDSWIRTIHVNLIGTYLCSRIVLPIFMKQKRGKIINIAGAGEGPFPNFSAYASSKSAIVRFTETLAEEVSEYHIDVNAVAPGGILTKMTEEVINAGDSAGTREKLRVSQIRETGGVGLDIPAQLVAFLASDDSNGLTGKLISATHDDWRNASAFISTSRSKDIFTVRRVDPTLLRRLKLTAVERERVG